MALLIIHVFHVVVVVVSGGGTNNIYDSKIEHNIAIPSHNPKLQSVSAK